MYNIFAGFQAVEIQFSRQDVAIVAVGSGTGGKVEITILTDITSDLNAGESVYLYAEGVSYVYNLVAKITEINFTSPNTVILTDANFIQVSSVGYVNHLQNYFVEAKLVDVANNDVQLYPELLSDDGTPSGDVFINVSGAVDYLSNEILANSGEIVENRIRFVVMYREVWRENQTNAFTLIDELPIIIVYAADNSSPETFVNDFDEPKMYEGYPFAMTIIHSLDNNEGERVSVSFDELDINQDTINLDNPLFSFSAKAMGLMQSNMADNQKVIEDTTRYIQFNANSDNLADYKDGDYKSGDYLTT